MVSDQAPFRFTCVNIKITIKNHQGKASTNVFFSTQYLEEASICPLSVRFHDPLLILGLSKWDTLSAIYFIV